MTDLFHYQHHWLLTAADLFNHGINTINLRQSLTNKCLCYQAVWYTPMDGDALWLGR